MEFDLDNALAALTGQPWDLSLKIGGKPYATRPLQVADLDRLIDMEGKGRTYQNGVLLDLFADPKPPVEAWDAAVISHVVAAVMGYQQGRLRKNSTAVATQVAIAAAKEARG